MTERYYVTNNGDDSTVTDSNSGVIVFAGKYDRAVSQAAELNRQTSEYYNQATVVQPTAIGSDDDRAGDNTKGADGRNKEPTSDTVADDGTTEGIQDTISDVGVSKIAESQSGTTQAGRAGLGGGTQLDGNGKSKVAPGRRPYNPLGDLSSYTYQLSLYMLTPEAYQTYVLTGKTNMPGVFVVAQSGGVNNNARRAPGIDLDLYIDDLVFKKYLQGKSENGAINAVSFEFKIYEPYGFSFTQKLREAAWEVISNSRVKGIKENTNALAQFYMLGIKFYGYDEKGQLVEGGKYSTPGTNSSVEKNALFARYYPIKITDFKFKLDGKTVVYNIKAAQTGLQEGFGVKRAQVPNPIELVGETVDDILFGQNTGQSLIIDTAAEGIKVVKPSNKKTVTGLIQAMNEAEKNLFDTGKTSIANKYNIRFYSEDIANASIIPRGEVNKFKAPANTIETSAENNDATDARQTIDLNSRTVSINQGTPLLDVIDQVIGQSDYVTRALKTIIDESETEEESQVPTTFKWYNVNPIVVPLGYDTKRNDFAFEITYEIREYVVPFIQSVYVKQVGTYQGPHKIYNYWFTGKNTEVISYEQQYNSLYFIGSVKQNPSGKSDPVLPIVYNYKQNENTSISYGKAGEPVASIRASLYDPGSQARAKLNILGDPDYLLTTVGMNNGPYGAFYGPDYTINPNGGQVFVEINFKAVEDYDLKQGIMNVSNENIEFYRYPPALKSKINGIAYMVNACTSTFSKGKFTQELDLIIAGFENLNIASAGKAKSNTDRETASATNNNPDVREPSNSGSSENTNAVADQSLPVSTGLTGSLDPGKALEARTEFAATDPRRVDIAQDTGQGRQVLDDDGSYDRKDMAKFSKKTSDSDQGAREEPPPRVNTAQRIPTSMKKTQQGGAVQSMSGTASLLSWVRPFDEKSWQVNPPKK